MEFAINLACSFIFPKRLKMIGKMDFTNVNSFMNHADSNNMVAMPDKKAYKEEAKTQDDSLDSAIEVANLNKDHTQNVIAKMKLKKNNGNVSQKDLIDFIKSTSPIEIYETDSDADKAMKKIKNSMKESFIDLANITPEGKIEVKLWGWHMSGWDKEGKVTIWGKALGYDKSISQAESKKLMQFLQDTQIAGLAMFDSELLDRSDLSIEEFKAKWLKFKEDTEKSLGYNQAEQTSNPDESKIKKYMPQNVVRKSQTYKDEISKEFFTNFLKAQKELGVDILGKEILELFSRFNKINVSV